MEPEMLHLVVTVEVVDDINAIAGLKAGARDEPKTVALAAGDPIQQIG
jgi:hypothetical protein